MRNKRVKLSLLILISTISLVFYGFGIGKYQWPPYDTVKYLYAQISNNKPAERVKIDEYDGEKELIEDAFTDKVTNTGELIYSPILSVKQILEYNQNILIPADSFPLAYSKITILEAIQMPVNQGEVPIIKLNFEVFGRVYSAYAYGSMPINNESNKFASLIIPGSGINQSRGIAINDSNNYHYGIIEPLAKIAENQIYVLIKPNEDALAWHDGQGYKLNGSYIWNWHVNAGGSYSASYIVQSLAFAKWMKSGFNQILIAGLSQGGIATLIHSLQSEPDFAIVSSGYSILFQYALGAGHDQIIGLPNYNDLFLPEYIKPRVANTKTKWLFSWGQQEDDAYRIESVEGITKSLFSSIPNVECISHGGGHVFPSEQISSFLNKHIKSSQ